MTMMAVRVECRPMMSDNGVSLVLVCGYVCVCYVDEEKEGGKGGRRLIGWVGRYTCGIEAVRQLCDNTPRRRKDEREGGGRKEGKRETRGFRSRGSSFGPDDNKSCSCPIACDIFISIYSRILLLLLLALSSGVSVEHGRPPSLQCREHGGIKRPG